jgi:hypothetical protein
MIVPIQISGGASSGQGQPLARRFDRALIGAIKGLSAHGGSAEVMSAVRGDERLFVCVFITNQMLTSMSIQHHRE